MSAYEHGSQDISGHNDTYASVMRIIFWSSALLGIATLYLSMVFAGGMNWFTSLVVVYGLSILVGLGLKRSSTWYAAMTGVAALTAVLGFVVSLLASMI